MSRSYDTFKPVPTWEQLEAQKAYYIRREQEAYEEKNILDRFNAQAAQINLAKAQETQEFFNFSTNQWEPSVKH